MKEFQANATVYCTDGVAGRLMTTITNPGTQKVTHIVIAELQSPHIKRLVPIRLVEEIAPDAVRLNCTCQELSNLEPLESTLTHPTDRYIAHLASNMNYVYV